MISDDLRFYTTFNAVLVLANTALRASGYRTTAQQGHHNPAFRDEFFGTVAMFFRVKDEAAAIALANDSDFGLGGTVFTKDVARGK